MLYALYIVFFVSCLVLVAAVLLQPGKTDAGALFTSNVSSAAFGPRGTASVLSKLTIVAAILFMLSALMISMPVFSGNISVLNSAGDIPVEQPATDQQAQPANTNSVPDNSNGALIETPATNSFSNSATGSTNSAPAANSNATAPANK